MAENVKPSKPTTDLDFSKVFASNASTQPFTWLDSEYLRGWEAIQQTPPSRQQFDALQLHSDKKENWLYQRYLEGYVDKFLDYLDTVKAPINSPDFTGTPKSNGIPLGYGVGEHSYAPWYFWLGDYYVVQYVSGDADSNGIAKLSLHIAAATTSGGTGMMIAIPVVYTTQMETYSFAIGGSYPYRTANEIWVAVRDGETGEPAAGAHVSALCWCVPA